MGQKFIVHGGKDTKMLHIPIEKYTMLGESLTVQPAQVKVIGDSMGM